MGMQVTEKRDSARNGRRHGSLPPVESVVESRNSGRIRQPRVEEESWMLEESWTAIVGYMAELALPGEG